MNECYPHERQTPNDFCYLDPHYNPINALARTQRYSVPPKEPPMNVTRYYQVEDDYGNACGIEKHPQGDYVRYDDYQALLDEHIALVEHVREHINAVLEATK